MKPKKPDFEQVISNFLQKELLADQYVNLEQAGHANEDSIPIARVFIDAPASGEPTINPPDEKLKDGKLNDILKRRTSRFGDNRVWNELALPEGLRALLKL